MVLLFDNDEAAYLRWVNENPDGFVVNIDRGEQMPMYPMVHSAKHRSVSSASIGNFTTGEYVKYCCTNLAELEAFAERQFRLPLNRCRQCM